MCYVWESEDPKGQASSITPKVSANPTAPSPSLSPAAPEVPELMQLGLLWPPLSPEEKLHQHQNNHCLYCGGAGHYASTCPNKIRKSYYSPYGSCSLTMTRSAHIAVPVSPQLSEGALRAQAINDSSACSCFIDHAFAQQHNISLQPKQQRFSIQLADGSSIKSGPITHET